MPTTLLWFRQDLRLDDNPALTAAAARGEVLPIYVWAPEEEGQWQPGGASRWWLHQSLAALAKDLEARRSRLLIRRGPTMATLRELATETGASAIYWNRRYEPAVVARDATIKRELRETPPASVDATEGFDADSFNGALLHEPWSVQTGQGGPYKVFTPFWKACLAKGEPTEPAGVPSLRSPRRWPASLPLEALSLQPTIDWAGGLRETWTPGERGAHTAMHDFLADAVSSYAEGRDIPGQRFTSRLSPHLHFGEISPRRIWHETASALLAAPSERRSSGRDELARSVEKFLAEVGWREFAHHLIFHFPRTAHEPLRSEFAKFPWRRDPEALRAWRRGRTGYPLVDAGMRELWHTGWMHNRVRMVAASFLVKHLLLPWQDGAAWFWETLVDADLASNTLGWQWTAGCGADAAPYFRIFNPVSQGEKFDADGSYVRRWVPELAKLPNEFIHAPWSAPALVRAAADVELGTTYPKPIVDHAEARARALAALATISRAEAASP